LRARLGADEILSIQQDGLELRAYYVEEREATGIGRGGEIEMSGSTGRRASGASEHSGAEDSILTWGKSNVMLPLVDRIAQDILAHQVRLTELYTERESLDRQRHSLAWPERARRYRIGEEITDIENSLRGVLTELDNLGLTLLDPGEALIGFPTRVNERKAFFTWKSGETKVLFWTYAGELFRRSIPAQWTTHEAEESFEKVPRKSR